jgi:hypothetical protein
MSPIGRRGGTTNDPDALDTLGADTAGAGDRARGGCEAGASYGDGCDTGLTSEPGTGVASDFGAAGTAACGGTESGPDGFTGADGGDDGGIDGGAYDTGPCGRATCAGPCCGYAASSWILCVGATRGSPLAGWRAPQPPQNRESGAFSVPQVAQRIPPSG